MGKHHHGTGFVCKQWNGVTVCMRSHIASATDICVHRCVRDVCVL